MSLNFAFSRELYISVSRLRAIMLCSVTYTPIYINVFEFCILQRIIYIGESAACHNVICHLDPHKTSMPSMLKPARLFSLQSVTSLSSRPACSLSSHSPLPSTPRGTVPAGDTGEAESHNPGKVVHDHDADTNQNPTAGECSFTLYYSI